METPKQGSGKIWSGVVAAGLVSYGMNWLSLHGVNFELLGIDSEVVKSSIIASIAGGAIKLTPENIVQQIKCFIIFIRRSVQEIKDAANNPLPPNGENP